MKKNAVLLVIALLIIILIIALLLSWRNKKDIQEETPIKIDIIEDKNIETEICKKYIQLAECIINNTHDSRWTNEMKNELSDSIKAQQESRTTLWENEQIWICSNLIQNIQRASDLEEIWCSIDL